MTTPRTMTTCPRSIRALGVAVVLGVASAAVAVAEAGLPTVSISSPAEGAMISRSVTPALQVHGGVEFTTPVAGERQFFVRRTGCAADQRLSERVKFSV